MPTKESTPTFELSTIEQLGTIANTIGTCVDLLTDKIKDTEQFRVLEATVEALQSVALKVSQERKALLAKLNEVICELETFRDDRTWDDQETKLLMEFSRFHRDAERGIIELAAVKPEEKVKVAS